MEKESKEIVMAREIRYQGAIIKDDQMLLIMHHALRTGETYWVVPGGGILEGETEEACVVREMREETNLEVEVVKLLIDEPTLPGDPYKRTKTYLCRPIGGEAAPGYEPEIEASSVYAISEVKWFDLNDPGEWGLKLSEDPFTYPTMQKIRQILGYGK
jgi:8-oxo-dGTP diphosphatase